MVTAREVNVGAAKERGAVVVHLDLDRKHAERLICDAFRALPTDALGPVLADLISFSPDTHRSTQDILAELGPAPAEPPPQAHWLNGPLGPECPRCGAPANDRTPGSEMINLICSKGCGWRWDD